MNELSKIHALGKSINHDSSLRQTTGEAKYIDDIATSNDTLHLALVLSAQACGKINKIIVEKALSLKGVYYVLTYKDIPGENKIGPIIHDEPALAERRVEYIGQPVAVVIAKNHNLAQKASKLVEISIEKDEEPILNLNDSLSKNSLVMPKMKLLKGSPEEKIKKSKYSLKGDLNIGGQDHF